MKPKATTGQAGTRRWLRRVLRTLAAAASLAVVLLGVVGLLLGHLDHPLVKRRVQAIVRSTAGLEVDYASTRVRPLSGIQVDGLVLWSPAEFRSVAPNLLRIGRLEATWSVAALLRDGARLQRVAAEGVELAIAQDARGRSSLDALSRGAEPGRPDAASSLGSPTPAAGAAPRFDRLDVSGLDLTWVRVDGGQVQDRIALRGLALHAEVHRDGNGWHLEARAGRPTEPLSLLLVRDGAAGEGGHARLALWLAAQAGGSGATVSLDLGVGEQTLVPRVSIRELLRIDVTASVDPARRSTEISVSRARAADGAATIEARLSLPDAPDAPLLVREASGTIDLDRLLGAMPSGLLPFTGRGRLDWSARAVEMARSPRFLPEGSLSADGEFIDLKLRGADAAATAGGARLAIRVRPAPEGTVAQGSARIRDLAVAMPGRTIAVNSLEVNMDASRDGEGAWTGAMDVGLGTARLSGSPGLALRGVRLEARASRLRLASASPLSATGRVEVGGGAASIDAVLSGTRIELGGVRLRLAAPLTGGAPFAVKGGASARNVRVVGPDDRLLGSAPASVELNVTGAVPDRDRPAASRAKVQLNARFGPLEAWLEARKLADSLDFTLTANGHGLPLGRFLPQVKVSGSEAASDVGLWLSGSGHVGALLSGNPSVRQRTELRLDGPGMSPLLAKRLTVAVNSSGDLRRHRAEVDLRFDPLAETEAWHALLSAEVERSSPALRFQLTAEGGPSGSLSGSARLDGSAGVVQWELAGKLAGLSPLRPLLSRFPALNGVRLARLELDLKGSGTVSGMVSAGADGSPRFAEAPLLSAEVDGAIDLRASGIRWQRSELVLAVPAAAGRLEIRTQGLQHGFRGDVQVDALQLLSGAHKVDAAGVAAHLTGSIDRRLRTGEADLGLGLTVRSLTQDFAPYPTGNLDLQLAMRRSPEGVLRISNLRLENPAGGTILSLQGGLDRGNVKRRLSLQGQLQQDVARAWSAPESFEGRGRIDVTFRVESTDLTIFRTQADVRLEDIHASFPLRRVAIQSLDGEIPISADVARDDQGLTLLRNPELNPFSTYRVADQHPFQTRASFVAVQGISTPVASISAMAGNLRVEQNLISFTQFEMEFRGGIVAGELVLDWNGRDSVFSSRIRATGVESTHGEPFDGSASFVVTAAERAVDGRIDILRIGSNHLSDLLDLQDPLRTDPATNRIRFAMNFGHPDGVRVELRHGFARMKVTLGGLASLLRVGDLRGIPTGPIIDKVLAPMLKREDK